MTGTKGSRCLIFISIGNGLRCQSSNPEGEYLYFKYFGEMNEPYL